MISGCSLGRIAFVNCKFFVLVFVFKCDSSIVDHSFIINIFILNINLTLFLLFCHNYLFYCANH